MQARMTNPAKVLPGDVAAAQNLYKATYQSGVEQETLELVHLRASQLIGCSACVGYVDEAKRAEMATGCGWSPPGRGAVFTDAERAALALAESMTRLADRSGDAVSDELWTELSKHYTRSSSPA